MTKASPPRRIVDQITTTTDKRFEPVARMADAIVRATLETGDCTQQDLHTMGFARQDITVLWHFANALAAIELKCRANGICSSYEREVRYA